MSERLAYLSIMRYQLRAHLKSPVHPSTIVFRGVRGAPNWVLIMQRDASFSNNECDFIQSVISSGSKFPFQIKFKFMFSNFRYLFQVESSTGLGILRCCYCSNSSQSWIKFIGQILWSDRGLFFNANVTVEYFMKEPSHRLLPGKLDTSHACIYII